MKSIKKELIIKTDQVAGIKGSLLTRFILVLFSWAWHSWEVWSSIYHETTIRLPRL